MARSRRPGEEEDAAFVAAVDAALERVREHLYAQIKLSQNKGVTFSFRYLHGTRASYAFAWPKLGELTCLLQYREHNQVQKITIDDTTVDLIGELICSLALSSREQSQRIFTPTDLPELPSEERGATDKLQMLASGKVLVNGEA